MLVSVRLLLPQALLSWLDWLSGIAFRSTSPPRPVLKQRHSTTCKICLSFLGTTMGRSE